MPKRPLRGSEKEPVMMINFPELNAYNQNLVYCIHFSLSRGFYYSNKPDFRAAAGPG
jgi:hypothetical protein